MAMDISALKKLNGFIGACLVDSDSGMILTKEGGGSLDLEVAAAANTEVVRAKRRALAELNLDDKIEDILITLGTQYHVMVLVPSNEALFVYTAVDREQGNLALTRVSMKSITSKIKI